MGIKSKALKVLAGESQQANKLIGEQFSNLENKMITILYNELTK